MRAEGLKLYCCSLCLLPLLIVNILALPQPLRRLLRCDIPLSLGEQFEPVSAFMGVSFGPGNSDEEDTDPTRNFLTVLLLSSGG